MVRRFVLLLQLVIENPIFALKCDDHLKSQNLHNEFILSVHLYFEIFISLPACSQTNFILNFVRPKRLELESGHFHRIFHQTRTVPSQNYFETESK